MTGSTYCGPAAMSQTSVSAPAAHATPVATITARTTTTACTSRIDRMSRLLSGTRRVSLLCAARRVVKDRALLYPRGDRAIWIDRLRALGPAPRRRDRGRSGRDA